MVVRGKSKEDNGYAPPKMRLYDAYSVVDARKKVCGIIY